MSEFFASVSVEKNSDAAAAIGKIIFLKHIARLLDEKVKVILV